MARVHRRQPSSRATTELKGCRAGHSPRFRTQYHLQTRCCSIRPSILPVIRISPARSGISRKIRTAIALAVRSRQRMGFLPVLLMERDANSDDGPLWRSVRRVQTAFQIDHDLKANRYAISQLYAFSTPDIQASFHPISCFRSRKHCGHIPIIVLSHVPFCNCVRRAGFHELGPASFTMSGSQSSLGREVLRAPENRPACCRYANPSCVEMRSQGEFYFEWYRAN